jgi:tRNA (cmo5U34)-methyltransferase
MTDPQNQWTEEDSQRYQEIAAVAVPARAEQIAVLLTLLPFNQHDSFRAVEVGCGEGILSEVLLTCFPNATVTALDGSDEMRVKTARRLNSFNQRVEIETFDLALPGWHKHLRNADCVLSSLVIHHLDDRGKRDLYTTIYNQLSQRGALLIADLIEPQRPEAKSLFASTWDHITKTQSIAEVGSEDLFEKFEKIEWNYYRYYDPFDKPSHLFDQLLWLKEIGFISVDCFWMQAGHAIYGGYKTPANSSIRGLRFEDALQIAQTAMRQ